MTGGSRRINTISGKDEKFFSFFFPAKGSDEPKPQDGGSPVSEPGTVNPDEAATKTQPGQSHAEEGVSSVLWLPV